jgi:hypothetical protein
MTNIDTRMLIEDAGGKTYVKPQFKISFSHQGTGVVMKPGNTKAACSGKVLPPNVQGYANLDDIRFSNFKKADFDCFPADISLIDNEESITCTLKPGKILAGKGSYQTPLDITVSYGYVTSASKEINIKKILTY